MPVYRVNIHDPLGTQIAVTEFDGNLSAVSLKEELAAENSGWRGKLVDSGNTARGLTGTVRRPGGQYILILTQGPGKPLSESHNAD